MAFSLIIIQRFRVRDFFRDCVEYYLSYCWHFKHKTLTRRMETKRTIASCLLSLRCGFLALYTLNNTISMYLCLVGSVAHRSAAKKRTFSKFFVEKANIYDMWGQKANICKMKSEHKQKANRGIEKRTVCPKSEHLATLRTGLIALLRVNQLIDAAGGYSMFTITMRLQNIRIMHIRRGNHTWRNASAIRAPRNENLQSKK